jgi:hypothetical protein
MSKHVILKKIIGVFQLEQTQIFGTVVDSNSIYYKD